MDPQQNVKQQTKQNLFKGMLIFFFFLFFYLYVWLRIDPGLINQYQDTLFLFDSTFFNQFLQYPGGLIDYASAFLSQFFIYPWLGAFIITLLAGGLYFLTYRIIRSLCDFPNSFLVPFIPVLLILVLHSDYAHPLSVDLGLLFALGFFILFIQTVSLKTALHFVIYVLVAGLLYFLTAGHLFLFTLLCILYELLYTKHALKERILSLFFYILIPVLIPYLSVQLLFMVALKFAYDYTLPFGALYQPSFAPYLLYAIFPLILVLMSAPWKTVSQRLRKALGFLNTDIKFLKVGWSVLFQTALLLLITGVLIFVSFDRNTNILLRMDWLAQRGRWADILTIARHTPSEDIRKTYFTNRALYHTGQLTNRMFSFPQKWGTDGLSLPEEFSYKQPMLKSDLFLELGYVNEAQHMAHEGLSQKGERPRILQRLTVTNLLKGEKNAALMYLSKLDKTLFYKNWSKQVKQYVDNDSLLQKNPILGHIRSLMVDSDFIAVPKRLDMDLQNLLSNKKNKMAYEYLMAYFLLEGRLDSFIENIKRIRDFNYLSLPTHYEEAVLIYMVITGERKIDLPGYRLSYATVNRYKELKEILNSYKGDKDAARKDLQKSHGDTFWFYLMYNNPKTTDR